MIAGCLSVLRGLSAACCSQADAGGSSLVAATRERPFEAIETPSGGPSGIPAHRCERRNPFSARRLLWHVARFCCLLILAFGSGGPVEGGQAPAPVLQAVFPCGAQVGQVVEVTVTGANLTGLKSLICSVPGVECSAVAADRFRLQIPADTMPGYYDVRVLGEHGLSGPRQFVVGRLGEILEVEPNDSPDAAQHVPLGCEIGRAHV